MDMTGAFLSDIGAGLLAYGSAGQNGGTTALSDPAGDSFKGILGSILTASAKSAVSQTVFTSDPIAADVPEKADMSLMSSKEVTEAAMSPATERALKYLSGSVLENVMSKPDGYFTTQFFDMFKYKTELDLDKLKENADKDEKGVTDLWTALLDSLNKTEITEMSMFSANLGDALFGSERDYSKSSASVLSDVFDSLSTRNKTDFLKAAGTDFADIAAMALMASSGMSDIAGLMSSAAANSDETDMSEADNELSMLIESADDETAEAAAEMLSELVSQAESKFAEDVPEAADNKSEQQTKPVSDSKPTAPVFQVPEDAAAAAAAPIQQTFAETVSDVQENNGTVQVQSIAADTAAETAVNDGSVVQTVQTVTAEVKTNDKIITDDRPKSEVYEIADELDMETVTVTQETDAETNTPDLPDGSLKDLYLKMRNFSRTSAEDNETPFVFEALSENAEIPEDEMTVSEPEKSEKPEFSSEKREEEVPADDGEEIPEFAVQREDMPLTAAPADTAKPDEIPDTRSIPEDRYNTLQQVLSRIEENSVPAGGTRELVIKLTPEALGEITVKIAKDTTGAVEITLAAQNRDVSELISSRASELAQSLSDKGAAVSSVNVIDPAQSGQNLAFDMNGGQNAFNFRQQETGERYGTHGIFAVDDEDEDEVASVSAVSSSDDNIFISKEAKLWQKI